MIAAFRIFLGCDGGAWTDLVEDLAEKGIVDCGFALDNSIVMIQNEAGVFQQDLTFFCAIISNGEESGNQEILLAIIERMCYNKENEGEGV